MHFFLVKKNSKNVENVEEKKSSIFRLEPAIKFAVLIVLIKISTKIALTFFGESAFVITSLIASFAGMDAIIINLAELLNLGKISTSTAILTFVATNAVNLFAKSFYSYLQGSKEFLKFLSFGFLVIIFASFLGFLFVL